MSVRHFFWYLMQFGMVFDIVGVNNKYMRYRFSELTEKVNTQVKFDKWVEQRKKDIKELAYENRSVIDKNSIQRDIDEFDKLKGMFKRFTTLRKKSDDYDLVIGIDNKGYTSFYVYFPITQKQLDDAVEYRRKRIAELGRWGSACISLDDAVWSTLHEKVYKLFSFTRPITAIQSFDKYGSGLVRKMQIFGFQ